MKKILISLLILFAAPVLAQNGDPLPMFRDICPTVPVPQIQQMNPVVSGTYFWVQYVNFDGDLVVVFMTAQLEEGSRQIYAGDWC
jgi:hypothetical protein